MEIETIQDGDDHGDDNSSRSNDNGSPPTIQLGFSEAIRPDVSDVIGHRSPKWWTDWDGGQIGGRPSWLQPRDLPVHLRCKSCSNKNNKNNSQQQQPLQFICQLYVPLDNTPRAFHRSFYIFGCPTCCQQQSSKENPSVAIGKGIRVLRVQLPQENEFYPLEDTFDDAIGEEDTNMEWDKHLPSAWNVHLCQVCGQRATGKCPLQQVWFCGKEHQKEYKRATTTKDTNDNSRIGKDENKPSAAISEEKDALDEALLVEEPIISALTEAVQSPSSAVTACFPSLYKESELVVEEEPAADKNNNGDDDDDGDDDEEDEIEARPAMFPSTPGEQGDHDSDEDLEQEDLNEIVTGKKSLDQTSTKDPATNRFYRRIQDRKVPDQCLRYSMEFRQKYDVGDSSDTGAGGSSDTAYDDKGATKNADADNDDERHNDDSEPLWIRSNHQPPDIPPCPYCQAPRAFEFQLMPQMLSFLHSNRSALTPQSGSGSGDEGDSPTTPSANKTAKQALIAAQSIIDSADPSQVPPSFADAKAKAMKALQDDLYQGDDHRVDWGVVAIYSCTKSCAGSSDPELGAYREEYAWLQPPLDV